MNFIYVYIRFFYPYYVLFSTYTFNEIILIEILHLINRPLRTYVLILYTVKETSSEPMKSLTLKNLSQMRLRISAQPRKKYKAKREATEEGSTLAHKVNIKRSSDRISLPCSSFTPPQPQPHTRGRYLIYLSFPHSLSLVPVLSRARASPRYPNFSVPSVIRLCRSRSAATR